MLIKSATFQKSASDLSECPPSQIPEFSLIGRSNVGKSSLINVVTNHSHLAKTSSKPGKTRLINFFSINESWGLVDLPGYGFAKASKSQKDQFNAMVSDYLNQRENHICTLQLIDSRHSPQKIDLEFSEWLVQQHIPFVLIFTKIDKVKGKQIQSNINSYLSAMSVFCQNAPKTFTFSSINKAGRKELLSFISQAIDQV